MRVADGLAAQFPLHPGRKSGAAPAPQPRVRDLADDVLGAALQRRGKARVRRSFGKDHRARLHQAVGHHRPRQPGARRVAAGIQRQAVGFGPRPQRRDDRRGIPGGQAGQHRAVDHRRRFLVGHADVAGPAQRERPVPGHAADRRAGFPRKGIGHGLRPLHQRNRRPRQVDGKAAARPTVKEGVERRHVLDLDPVQPKPRGNGGDDAVIQMPQPLLDLLHHFHQARAVRIHGRDRPGDGGGLARIACAIAAVLHRITPAELGPRSAYPGLKLRPPGPPWQQLPAPGGGSADPRQLFADQHVDEPRAAEQRAA